MPDQSSAATEHAILQEITRPLEALPDDPLAIVNADFPTALRGYDRVAVEEYVRRTRQLVAELQATRSPEAAVRRALERVGEEITGILQRAHETAEQITVQSRREAEDRMEHARQEAAQVAGAAEQRVRELDADTDRIWLERQRIVADAEELAAQLLALAKAASDRFPADGEASAAAAAAPVYDEAEEAPRPPAPSLADEAEEADEEYYEDFAEEDDVEETVAFQPLPRTEARPAAEEPPAEEEVTVERDPSEDATIERRATDEPAADRPAPSDDTTAVIPPASQAANRKLSE